jgi:hypothetical protein
MKRTQKEIENQIDLANEIINKEALGCFGMSYEDGVKAALQWVIGETDDLPIEEE